MNFDCLNINDIIKLIVIWEITSFVFVTGSSLFFDLCMHSKAFRKFMAPNRKSNC